MDMNIHKLVRDTLDKARRPGNKQRGVRLHHPTLRNCVWTIQQQSRLYPSPYRCPTCGITHTFKTFHLNLNEYGDVVVSPELFETFKEERIIEEMKATKEVIPRPNFIGLPTIDNTGQVMMPGVPPVPRFDPPVEHPPVVVSREEGVVKVGGISRRNQIQPPADKFRQEPDGSWTALERT